MCAFWSSVALMTGRYHGTPMVKHMPLPVDAGHFDRWLELFEATAREICPPEAAERISWSVARRIAASLELGVAGGQGVMLGTGERFRRRQEQERFNERIERMSSPTRTQADPYSGSSLVPMLVAGLVLTLAGMIRGVRAELKTIGRREASLLRNGRSFSR